mmetsp:Transcript_21219/g.31463  ORF Transcript_21219/g.31463 Transcript_21219/m.31463 type:complete len:283 (+) Transcript_21219:93-941(+)
MQKFVSGKIATLALVLLASYTSAFNHGGQTKRNTLRHKLNRVVVSYSQEDENSFVSLKPETSFGAEAVPEGQRPVNEYLDLLKAPLFGWASEEVGTTGLLTRLAFLYAVVFAVVCYPISGATFTQEGFELQKLASSNLGATTLVIFVLVRLYSGWGYVGSRLKSKVIEYEETGWYDGDIEYKSEAEKQRDRLLYQENVKPVEDRLKLVSAGAAIVWVISCVSLNFALNAKPVFNEYDPRILEKLRVNDRLADVAADQSFSRPTYCDSRYYRAIANGGQGCEK